MPFLLPSDSRRGRAPALLLAAMVVALLFTCGTLVRRTGRSATAAACAADERRPAPAWRDTLAWPRLVLHVPAFRLDVVDHDTLVARFPVAVGQRAYPTPEGSFAVDYIVWNPRWVPPESDWAKDEEPKGPGADNPMGRVKVHVDGLVFVHGTPLDASIGSAASHACVRMHNADAIALARLLHRAGNDQPLDEPIDALLADTTHTETIALDHAIPAEFRYTLAEIAGDSLVLYPDIYRRGTSLAVEQAVAALTAAGLPPEAVDSTAVRRALAQVRTTARSFPVDGLDARRAPAPSA